MKFAHHFLLVCLLIFSSCAGERFSETENSPSEPQSFKGVISSKKLSIDNPTTHILWKDSNQKQQIAEISSRTLDLNNYLNQEVKISGSVFQTKPLQIQVEKIELSTEAVSPHDFIEWQKFSEKEHRFAFIYPKTWQIYLSGPVTYLKKSEQVLVKIIRIQNPRQKELKDFTSSDAKEVNLNQQKSLKVISEWGPEYYLNGVKEIIKINLFNSQNDINLAADLDKFLNSFTVFSQVIELNKCGGSQNLLCPEGYRCELGAYNQGECVSIKSPQYPNLQSEEKLPELPTADPSQELDPLVNVSALPGETYQNSSWMFQINYPRAWWFKSFGEIKPSFYHLEFSPQEIKEVQSGKIILEILPGARGI
nr:hypothetical protein [Candidatus Gracilibacteria bacterium]